MNVSTSANFLTHSSACGSSTFFVVGNVCAPFLGCHDSLLKHSAYGADFADGETDVQREGNDSLKATQRLGAEPGPETSLPAVPGQDTRATLACFVTMPAGYSAQRTRTTSVTAAHRSRRTSKKMRAEKP